MLTEIKNDHEHYFIDENYNRQGEFKEWYLNGQLFRHTFLVDNQLHGEFKSWLSNGRMWRHCFYIKGTMFTFRDIPYPTTSEDLMYFKLKYDALLLPVEDYSITNGRVYKQNKINN